MKLVTVAEMLKIEKEADAGGHTYEKMMEAAGRGLAEAVEQLAAQLPDISAYGLVGSGNNGGDTLVALAHLASEFGWTVGAYLVRPRPEGDPYVARLEAAGGRVSTLAEDKKYRILHEGLANHAVLLDGILGTGLKLPLHKEIGKLLEAVKTGLATLAGPPQVVAVDCPSGVDCELGDAAPETVPADLTVTMAAVKAGLLRFPAYGLVGELQVVGIGLPEKVKAWQAIKRSVAEPSMIQPLMPARPLDAHKGTFGTVLVIGGSVNYTGAPLLTGKAAYRVGAGLVTLAVPIPLHDAIAGHFPEATWLLLPHEVGVIAANAIDVVEKHLARPTAVALGPGIGLEDTTREFIGYLIGTSTRGGRKVIGFLGADQEQGEKVRANLPPLVVDADGLTLLRHYAEWWRVFAGRECPYTSPRRNGWPDRSGQRRDPDRSTRSCRAIRRKMGPRRRLERGVHSDRCARWADYRDSSCFPRPCARGLWRRADRRNCRFNGSGRGGISSCCGRRLAACASRFGSSGRSGKFFFCNGGGYPGGPGRCDRRVMIGFFLPAWSHNTLSRTKGPPLSAGRRCLAEIHALP